MIAHIDMDAFFARCEELRNPRLEEKPVVICIYTRNETSGAVSTSNYRARELGINSGMPITEAREKADEDTVFLPADHEYYRQKSEEVMSVLRSHSRKIEKTSIDEAYFRIKGGKKEARKIKARIESKGLSASIGIAPNKFLAKLASEEEKPDGLYRVGEGEEKQFLNGKKVEKLHGVGSKTAEKLAEEGIETVEQLRSANNAALADRFGRKNAASLKDKSEGKGSRKLGKDEQKQISRIKTMERNSRDPDYIRKELQFLAESLANRVEEKKVAFRGITLIAVDADLQNYTRSKKIDTSDRPTEALEKSEDLLEKLLSDPEEDIRRVGIRISDLVDTSKQSKLSSF
ncbi:MAG: DNA polymerase IV [Candidatus Nanohaloarchaea archaeon]